MSSSRTSVFIGPPSISKGKKRKVTTKAEEAKVNGATLCAKTESITPIATPEKVTNTSTPRKQRFEDFDWSLPSDDDDQSQIWAAIEALTHRVQQLEKALSENKQR